MKLYLHYVLTLSLLILGGLAVAINVTSKETAAPASYVGQETCMSSGCHADYENKIYQGAEKFRETMHQKIHLRPTPENVVIDSWFERDTILKYREGRIRDESRDTLYIQLSKGEGKTNYYIQMWFGGPQGDSTPKMEVAYTYGGQGWLQRYLVQVDENYYIPPFQYVLPEYRSTADTGAVYYLDFNKWYSYDPNTDHAIFFDQNSNKFRDQSWDKNCTACHVNGFNVEQVAFGPNNEDSTWISDWYGKKSGDSALRDQNILIGCESCHGPGSDHVANPTADNIVAPSNKNQFPDTKEGTDLKLDLCNQCHNRHNSNQNIHTYQYDDVNNQPYIPGQPLAPFVKDNPRVWDDKLTSIAHHQTGQDYERSHAYDKRIFPDGCWSCHTVHHNEEDIPFMMDRNWYSLEAGEGCQALGCHFTLGDTEQGPGGQLYNKHSKHLQQNSQCVNCHFTKTATITFVGTLEFTDHSFKVIRPTATKDFAGNGLIGMLNTCASSCHRNGRGDRNSKEGDMVAPDYGIVDAIPGIYKEQTDLDLADSLWEGFKRLYPQYVSSVRVSGERGTATSVSSIFPNPVSATATINFMVAKIGNISLSIYDIQGKRIKLLAEGRHEPGTYQDTWNATNELGANVANGTYFVRLETDGLISSRKIVVAR